MTMRPTLHDIAAQVAFHMGLHSGDIVGRMRTPPYARARAAVVWLARTLMRASFPWLGRRLGGRDHTTILCALRKGEALRETDPAFRMLTDRIVAHFNQPEEA